jgi:hypothetical protein
MVWNTPQEEEIMGRKPGPLQEPGPKVLSTQTPHYVDLPTYARLQLPLTANDSRMRRMAEELRGLASQIDFCITRPDLHITRRLHLIHLEFRHLNQRWLEETKQQPGYSEKQMREINQKYTNSGNSEGR